MDNDTTPKLDSPGASAPTLVNTDTITDLAFADAAIDATDDAVVGTTTSNDATIRSWNAGAEELYGYSADEAIGQPFSMLEPEGEKGKHNKRRHKLTLGHPSDQKETVRRRKDGSRVYVRSWITSVRNAVGRIIGHSSIARDITGRRATEKRLRESESRYRRMVQAAGEGIWVLDVYNNTSFLNEPMAHMLGYTIDEMQSKSVFVFMDDAETLLSTAGIERRIHTDGIDRDCKLIRKDGTELWAIISTSPIFDDDGVYEGTLGMVTDVTDRRREADRQRCFLRDVLSSATDGCLSLCATLEELPTPLTALSAPIALSMSGGLRQLRQEIRDASTAAGFPDERSMDMVTAVGEAGMNAVCHVGEGIGQVFLDAERGVVQGWVTDSGTGISMENLPHATLKRGFSSAGTMGHGFKMILQTADRVFLLTRSIGTTVVLEQDRTVPTPVW